MTIKQFPATVMSGCGDQINVIQVEVSNVVVTDETANRFANELMDAARFFNHGDSTTVWIKVATKEIPRYVDRALERFAGFGIGLVISHGKACSHSPGPLLSGELRQRIASVSRHGQVWHPLVKTLVESMPED